MLLSLYQKSMKAVFSGSWGLRMGSRLCWKMGISRTQILLKVPIDTFQNKIFHLLIFKGKKKPQPNKFFIKIQQLSFYVIWNFLLQNEKKSIRHLQLLSNPHPRDKEKHWYAYGHTILLSDLLRRGGWNLHDPSLYFETAQDEKCNYFSTLINKQFLYHQLSVLIYICAAHSWVRPPSLPAQFLAWGVTTPSVEICAWRPDTLCNRSCCRALLHLR